MRNANERGEAERLSPICDFVRGYVGGAPGKIDLYVKKECVRKGIPSDRAVDELVELIKANGRWKEP